MGTGGAVVDAVHALRSGETDGQDVVDFEGREGERVRKGLELLFGKGVVAWDYLGETVRSSERSNLGRWRLMAFSVKVKAWAFVAGLADVGGQSATLIESLLASRPSEMVLRLTWAGVGGPSFERAGAMVAK